METKTFMKTFMKTTILKLLVAGVAIIGVFSGRAESSSATGPVSLHVGISPYFDPGSAGLVLTNLEMLLAKLPEGVEFSLEDGSDGSIIASGTVPHFEYPGIAAQVRALAVQRVALRRWLTAVHAGGVPGSGALNPPIYMRSLADHPGSGRLVVALVGSVMYANLGEPSFDFAPDRLPKFAHLVLSENLTPFGCADRAALLSGVTVHWWYISKSVMPFEEYGNASRLWWQAWIQAQGGVLEGFSHDWASISSGFFRTVPPPKALDLVALAGPNPQPEMTKVCVRTNGVAGRAPHPPEAKSQPAPAPHQVVMNPISAPPPQPEPAQVPTPVPAVPASMPVAMPVPVVQKPVPPVPPVQAIEIPKEVDLTISSVGILWKTTWISLCGLRQVPKWRIRGSFIGIRHRIILWPPKPISWVVICTIIVGARRILSGSSWPRILRPRIWLIIWRCGVTIMTALGQLLSLP